MWESKGKSFIRKTLGRVAAAALALTVVAPAGAADTPADKMKGKKVIFVPIAMAFR